jgi:hypothetical protein
METLRHREKERGKTMKDVRFYLEFPSATAKKRSGKSNRGHAGNVFAGFVDQTFDSGGIWCMEGVGALFEYRDSPVCGTHAGVREFLRKQCKRIPERLARQIHPKLFERLDAQD